MDLLLHVWAKHYILIFTQNMFEPDTMDSKYARAWHNGLIFTQNIFEVDTIDYGLVSPMDSPQTQAWLSPPSTDLQQKDEHVQSSPRFWRTECPGHEGQYFEEK